MPPESAAAAVMFRTSDCATFRSSLSSAMFDDAMATFAVIVGRDAGDVEKDGPLFRVSVQHITHWWEENA